MGTNSLGANGTLEGTTIAVYGLGKMGLPLAAVLVDAGAFVYGVDIDESVVSNVNEGNSPVDEPGLSPLVESYGGDQLVATVDGAKAAEESEVMVVLVPTLLDDENAPELAPIIDVGRDIKKGVATDDLVILESTAPPGTTEGPFREAIESDGLIAGEDFGLAHCPERTSSGRVLRDLTESYPKIVGGIDDWSTQKAASMYRVFNNPGVIEVGSATAAEAVKVFEGVYRDVNIALANELAKACESWELDANEIFEAANTQPYCNIHTPGLGVGGHCIPVYPHFVTNQIDETPLLDTARQVNNSMPNHAVQHLTTLLQRNKKELTDSNVLVLGVTYRPGVKEIRNAPAIDIIDGLLSEGTTVFAHDPLLTEAEVSSFGAEAVSDPAQIDDLDGIVLATGHDEYRELDLESISNGMRTPVLVDGRRFFDENQLQSFDSVAIGCLQ